MTTQPTDSDLLRQYATGAEDAFAALVQRYRGLVHASALRQTNRPDLASDISQAVFLVLAKKAGTLETKPALAGWLLKTTRFIARRAILSEQRRKSREKEAHQMQELHTHDDLWPRIAPLIDEAFARLPEADRSLLAMRFLAGADLDQVSSAFGLKKETAKKRQARALEKVRAFLARRGCAVPTAVLAGLLATHLNAAPAPLSIIPSAAARELASAATAVNYLPLALAASICVLLSLVTATQLPRWRAQTAATAVPIGQLAAVPAAAQEQPVRDQPARTVEGGLRLSVVDSSGAPIAGVRVRSLYWHSLRVDEGPETATDASGVALVSLPPHELGRLDIGLLRDGFQQKLVTWRPDFDWPIPATYQTLLPSGVPIGGTVQDEHGVPLSGARIAIQSLEVGDSTSRKPKMERFGFLYDWTAATTDSAGRWHCAVVPADREIFVVKVSHPAFLESIVRPSDPLYQGQEITALKPGANLAGSVSAPDGRGISQALVRAAHAGRSALTGADGTFVLTNLPFGQRAFSVTADGFAPAFIERDPSSRESLNVTLNRGGPLHIQLVSPEGSPVSAARVDLEDTHRFEFDWREFTDLEGRVYWAHAPTNRPLTFYVAKEGHPQMRGQTAVPDGRENKIVLQNSMQIVATVADAQTGQPVPSFTVAPGYQRTSGHWDISETITATNGQFALRLSELDSAYRIRIEAEGYLPHDSDFIPHADKPHELAIHLSPADAAWAVHGQIFRADGTPAARIEVALGTLEHRITLGNAALVRRETGLWTLTDAQGKFMFEPQRWAHTVLAVDPTGVAQGRVREHERILRLTLQPWGRIEGRALKFDPDHHVSLSNPAARQYKGGVDLRNSFIPLRPDGTFAVEHVPPGRYESALAKLNIPWKDTRFYEVKSGATTPLEFGPIQGARITGRFLPEQPLGEHTIKTQHAVIYTNVPALLTHGNPSKQEQLSRIDFWSSDEAWQGLQQSRSYGLNVQPDGTFSGDGIQPGTYQIMAFLKLLSPEAAEIANLQLAKNQHVTIPPGEREISLGDIPLKSYPLH